MALKRFHLLVQLARPYHLRQLRRRCGRRLRVRGGTPAREGTIAQVFHTLRRRAEAQRLTACEVLENRGERCCETEIWIRSRLVQDDTLEDAVEHGRLVHV